MTSETKSQRETILFKNYVQGCETKIVKLLNLCLGDWGSVEKWRYKYLRYPTFTSKDVVVAEHDGEIVGHAGFLLRDLIVKNRCKVLAALFGDAAVHPDYRRIKIYSHMLKRRLDSAKHRGASLAFTWVAKDSVSYNACLKRGFVEVKRQFVYIKILRPEKILINRLENLLNKNENFKKTFHQFGIDVVFQVGNKKIRSKDLNDTSFAKKGSIQIILSEEALPSIVHFQRPIRLRRAVTLLFLVLSRKVKVKSSSPSIILKLIIYWTNLTKAL